MTTVFYLYGIIFLLRNMLSMASVKKNAKKMEELEKAVKKLTAREKTLAKLPLKVKEGLKRAFWALTMTVWIVIGIFTDQWVLFSSLLLIQVVFITPLLLLTKYNRAYLVLSWFSSLVNFIFALLIIINHFHLRLNLETLIYG